MKLILILGLVLFNHLVWGSEEQVEIHASLCPVSQDELLTQLQRESIPSKSRDIWYLDYHDLSLNDSGEILRIRRDDHKNKVSITVKLRGQNELDFVKPEIECEKDWYGEEEKISCSLDSSALAHDWDLAQEGKLSLTTLFSSAQHHFLSNNSSQMSWDNLKVFGLIKAQIWKFDDKTLEIWSMKSHDETLQIFEISLRAPLKEAPEAQRKLYHELNQRGVKLCPSHASKTRTVLEFLSH